MSFDRKRKLSECYFWYTQTDLGGYHLRIDFTSVWQHDLSGSFNIVQHEYWALPLGTYVLPIVEGGGGGGRVITDFGIISATFWKLKSI